MPEGSDVLGRPPVAGQVSVGARRAVQRPHGRPHSGRRGRGHGDHRARDPFQPGSRGRWINIFAWKGKVFDAKAGFLRNEILPFGVKAIVARVYKAPSWLDGKVCIVLDYSETSLVAEHIRDEIRLVDTGFYLGKVYWDRSG